MNEEVKNYVEKYPDEMKEMFYQLRELLLRDMPCEVEEKLWAKLPSYFVGEKYVRIIPFKDHVNIEAKAIMEHKEEFGAYKITPKGFLQIFLNQNVPTDALKGVFEETLL